MLNFTEKYLSYFYLNIMTAFGKNKSVYRDLKVIKLLTETENFSSASFVAGCVRKPSSFYIAHTTSNHTLTQGAIFAVVPSQGTRDLTSSYSTFHKAAFLLL